MRDEADGSARTCLSTAMERAGGVLVDELFAAVPGGVVDNDAFTLLFTKRCSLRS